MEQPLFDFSLVLQSLKTSFVNIPSLMFPENTFRRIIKQIVKKNNIEVWQMVFIFIMLDNVSRVRRNQLDSVVKRTAKTLNR